MWKVSLQHWKKDCYFGEHRNLIFVFLGKLSQEFPKNLGKLLNNYFPPKLLVTYGILVWRRNKDEKCLFPDGDPKPCKPDPMRNGPEIIKGISGFIDYWKKLCEEDITRRVRDTHEPLIVYWDRIRSALMTLGGNTCTTLT